jgi:DNA polymerase I
MSKLKVITKRSQVRELIRHCIKTGYCSFDFETSSTEYYNEDEYPTMLGVSFQPGSAWVIPLGHGSSPFKDNFLSILQLFGRKVLENPQVTKIAWNMGFEENWCRRYKINLKGRLFDAMLAKYLLDETRPNDLKSIVAKFIPEYAGYDDEIDKLSKKHGWAHIPMDKLAKYCGIDSDMELRLYLKFEPLLIKHDFYPLFRNLLMQSQRVLSDASYHGINIDVPQLYTVRDLYAQKIRDVQVELRNNPDFLKY